MVFTENDLQEKLAILREHGKKALAAVNLEFEEHLNWLESVRDGVKQGTINFHSVLVPKTPGKQRPAPFNAIRETLESSVELDNVRPTRSSTQNKRVSRKAQNKKAATKVKQAPVFEEEEDEIQISIPSKSQKRLSEEAIDSASKRLCGSRSSETTSRDSGLSSVGSRITRGSTIGGATVKHEVLTPKSSSLQSTTSAENENDDSHDNFGSDSTSRLLIQSSVVQSPAAKAPSALEAKEKRSASAGRGTFVVKQEPRRSSRSLSEPRDSTNAQCSSSDQTLTVSSEQNVTFVSLVASPGTPAQLKKQGNSMKSPIIRAPPAHLLKGESVKKAVKAFEALSEDENGGMAPPTMPPQTKPQPLAKTAPPPSLDDALNAPTRVTRTKTRAMAKAAADEEKKTTKPQDDAATSLASRALKSPTNYHQQKNLALKAMEKKVDYYEKENSVLTSSKVVMKPFGSASKQPQLFLKASTPLNRMTPLTPSHSASVSFSATCPLNNLVTSVESFLFKPVVHQEIKPSREENLQKLVAKAEVASKKKEEIMKAQMEERIKKRQEKRLKVCATREAMEKEKVEIKQKLEREREEKQKQLQAEREEKLRQEYIKKKRLALQKAAETEERRRQEEAARLAKLKQQEEEQRRIAAQRKKEQDEAERKQMERLQQEREAAAHRAREAERLAKEVSLKSKKVSKAQLDQTYDKFSPAPASESYGMTPAPEDRQPTPISNPDNYGIDDAGTDDSSEDESKPKKVVPLWAQPKYRVPKLMDDYEVRHKQMFSFFESKKSTPDLSKIFTAIDRRQLIRKSSAVWRTPPVKN